MWSTHHNSALRCSVLLYPLLLLLLSGSLRALVTRLCCYVDAPPSCQQHELSFQNKQ